MSDLNLLNAIFDQENFLLDLEKDDYLSKRIEKLEEEPNEWFTEDVLPLFDSFFSGGSEILQNAVASECSSDSGLSCEQSVSPTRNNDIDEFQSADAEFLDVQSIDSVSQFASLVDDEILSDSETINLPVDVKSFDNFEFVQEEVVEYEEIPVDSVYVNNSDSNSMSDVYLLRSDSSDGLNESDYLIESPLLLSYPDSKTVKVNNRGKRLKNVTNSPPKKIQQKRKSSGVFISEKDGSDDSDFLYPRLQLTPEEQKLAAKERIKLPTHYPLTRIEERELKRIRRKIRNKISAQDSRRRKKEYVDSLEERMKRTSEENEHLLKRIKTLENQRLTLAAQVRRLQTSLARSSGQTAQPSTCLLVLIMSLALVLAPTLKNSTLPSENNEDEGISLSEDVTTSALNSVRSSSRNLLFSHKAHEGQCNIEEETKAISEQLQKMQIPDSNVLTGLLELLKVKIGKESSSPKDHDYFGPRKRQNSEDTYGDTRVPLKMYKTAEHVVNAVIMENHNKTDNGKIQEPVIIDLLSD